MIVYVKRAMQMTPSMIGPREDAPHAEHEDSLNPVLLRHALPDDIPAAEDILAPDQLESLLTENTHNLSKLLFLGDVMLGDKAEQRIRKHGASYPFAGLMPLLRRHQIVIGNLEAPFATSAIKTNGRFPYRVDPKRVALLKDAGLTAVNLANNHLLDCGRAGVRQTFDALDHAGVGRFGAGHNAAAAGKPYIAQLGDLRVGFLGYYWNAKCAATADDAGCAIGHPETLRNAISSLKTIVDRVIVSFHWGITYQPEVSPEVVQQAHLAIESGADAVIGHHPHIIQPMEFHHGCPIFYSLGNCLMGSGNSKAEGIALSVEFGRSETKLDVYFLYAKNRDFRVNYQTKLVRGRCAKRLKDRLSNSLTDQTEWTFDGLKATLIYSNKVSMPP